MIALEEEEEFKRNLNLVEYLASFWNSEGVRKIKEFRERKENADLDEEFKEIIEKGDYKENPLLKALQKIRQNANLSDKDVDLRSSPKIRRIKAPIDLDILSEKTKI